MRRLPLLLLLAVPAPAQEIVETDHYRLTAEGERAEAEELGRVLEAAFPQFERWFKAKPSLRKGEKLDAFYYLTRAAWEEGLRGAGATVPGEAGGLYWEPTKAFYFYRQPTRLYTRTLLLHEAAHQFHFLARTRNKGPVAYWYREGVAEFLSWHHWDGRALELGILPYVALEDRPGLALTELKREDLDLEAVVEGKADGGRGLAWALYAHIATGKEGKPLKGFDTFARKMDGGVKPTPLFWKNFGRPPQYRKELLAWLEGAQQTWIPVFNEWESLGPGRLRGWAGVVSACRIQRQPLSHFQATIEVPKEQTRWRGGGLLSYVNQEDYAVFLVDWAGYLRITRRMEGSWKILEQGPGPGPSEDGLYHFELFRKGGNVYLMFKGGASYGPWELPGPAFGVAIENCDLVFRDLAWK